METMKYIEEVVKDINEENQEKIKEEVRHRVDLGKSSMLIIGGIFIAFGIGAAVGQATRKDLEETKEIVTSIFDGIKKFFPKSSVRFRAKDESGAEIELSASSVEEIHRLLPDAERFVTAMTREIAEGGQIYHPILVELDSEE